MSVLWESTSEYGEGGWQMEGWTGNYLRVTALSSAPRWNELDQVQLLEVDRQSLQGEIL
jgi:hypothetical protein